MVLTKHEITSYLSQSPPLIEKLVNPEVQIQPNGIDLSVLSLEIFQGKGKIGFSIKDRILPELEQVTFNSQGWVELPKGSYLITFNEILNLPNNLMAIGRPRSSLLRMGATIETAVWDAGFSGVSKSLLLVHNENGLRLRRAARVLQLVFIKLTGETEAYEGNYQKQDS